MESRARDCNEGLVRGGLLQVLFRFGRKRRVAGFDEAPEYWRDYVDRSERPRGSVADQDLGGGRTAPQGCSGPIRVTATKAVRATGGEFRRYATTGRARSTSLPTRSRCGAPFRSRRPGGSWTSGSGERPGARRDTVLVRGRYERGQHVTRCRPTTPWRSITRSPSDHRDRVAVASVTGDVQLGLGG